MICSRLKSNVITVGTKPAAATPTDINEWIASFIFQGVKSKFKYDLVDKQTYIRACGMRAPVSYFLQNSDKDKFELRHHSLGKMAPYNHLPLPVIILAPASSE